MFEKVMHDHGPFISIRNLEKLHENESCEKILLYQVNKLGY